MIRLLKKIIKAFNKPRTHESENLKEFRKEFIESDNESITKTIVNKPTISKYHNELMRVWGIDLYAAKKYGKIKHICFTTKSRRIVKKNYGRLGKIQNGR